MKYLKNFSINENVQQAKLLLTKLNKTQEDLNFVKIKNMLNGNGYTYWFTKMFFEKEVPMEELENVWRTIKSEANIISKFETPIVKLENTEKFWDEYYAAKGLSGAKSIYNEFPATQKKFVDLSNANDIQLLSDLAKDKEKVNLLRKISRYHTKEDLIKAIKSFVYNKTDSGFDKLLSNLKSSGCVIKYADKSDDIIIVTVDYDQLRRFGSDTSWCIVGSEYTFDSYNSGDLSQQFIIFLLDKNDIYSKIGITTDITGYGTGHLKNDEYIDFDAISKILDERGCDSQILYPSRETALSINWMKTDNDVLKKVGFTEEEIKEKKRKDIIGSNWDRLPVSFLLYSSFTKKEIVKKKQSYGDDEGDSIRVGKVNFYSKDDLSKFTKSEIESYGLLDKTVLRVSDLVTFSKDEIVEKGLIGRVKKITLSDLGPLGFSFDEIKKLGKTDKFKTDKVLPLLKGRKRESIIKLIGSYYLGGLMDNKSSRGSIDEMRANLMGVVNVGIEDMPMDYLLQSFDPSSFGKDIIEATKLFSKFYKNPTRSNIEKLVSMYGDSGKLKSCAKLIGSGYYKDQVLDFLKNNVLVDRYIEPNYRDMADIEKSLGESNKDIYEAIYTACRKVLTTLTGYYGKLLINSEYRGNDSKIEIDNTIHNLKFWRIGESFDLERMSNVFKGSELSIPFGMDKVLTFFKECGYDMSKPIRTGPDSYEKAFDTIKKMTKDYNHDITAAKYCVDNNIDIEGTCESLLEWIKGRKSSLPSYDLSKVEDILSKSIKYKGELKKITDNNKILEASESTKEASGYHAIETKSTPEKWYEEWWPILKNADLTSFKEDGWGENMTLINTVYLLSKLHKVDDLNGIDGNFKNWRNIGVFTKIISDRMFYNQRRSWSVELSEEDRQIMLNWLDKSVSDYTSENPDKKDGYDRYMLIDWYLFNRDKLNTYLSSMKKFKGSKVRQVSGLMKFVAAQGDFEYVEHILKSLNVTKSAKKKAYGEIYYDTRLDHVPGENGLYKEKSGGRYSNTTIKEVSSDRDREKEYSEKYKELLDKYLKPEPKDEIKESIIIRFKDFK